MKVKYRVFSQRYKTIIKSSDFAKEIDGNVKLELFNVLLYFNENYVEQPNAYDSCTIIKNTYDYVLADICSIYDYNINNNIDLNEEIIFKRELAFIFDIIESWLVHNEDARIAESINSVFEDYDLPWRIVNEQVMKIDSVQFEQDIFYKHMQDLEKVKEVDPKFQSAYKELTEAKISLTNWDYKNAILKAEQSYESIMKVILNESEGQASTLIAKIIKTDLFSELPKEINLGGFSTNVLQSLPYIRNRTMVGHGEGGENIVLTLSLARLSINLSCSLSSYLIELYKDSITYQQKLNKKQGEDVFPDEWK